MWSKVEGFMTSLRYDVYNDNAKKEIEEVEKVNLRIKSKLNQIDGIDFWLQERA